jgi:hypothetical protein
MAQWIGLGLREYFREGFNRFDCVIVLVSIAELIYEGISSDEETGGGGTTAVTSLRGMRLFRLFKLVRVWVFVCDGMCVCGSIGACFVTYACTFCVCELGVYL